MLATGLAGFVFSVPRYFRPAVSSARSGTLRCFPGRAPAGEVLLDSFREERDKSRATQANRAPGSSSPPSSPRDDSFVGPSQRTGVHQRNDLEARDPQYNLGHTARITALESLRTRFPGLYFSRQLSDGPGDRTCRGHAL